MTKDMAMIMGALELLTDACDNIKDSGMCDRCPFNLINCFEEDAPILSVAYDTPVGSFEKMLELSDEAINTDTSFDSYHQNLNAETQRELDAWDKANMWAGVDPSWATIVR